uniref:Uncharacterized protein n=1 Tax=Vitrella brassicaformis TaxID=1169539 RepID=A0A7S1PC46_9ALVE
MIHLAILVKVPEAPEDPPHDLPEVVYGDGLAVLTVLLLITVLAVLLPIILIILLLLLLLTVLLLIIDVVLNRLPIDELHHHPVAVILLDNLNYLADVAVLRSTKELVDVEHRPGDVVLPDVWP